MYIDIADPQAGESVVIDETENFVIRRNDSPRQALQLSEHDVAPAKISQGELAYDEGMDED